MPSDITRLDSLDVMCGRGIASTHQGPLSSSIVGTTSSCCTFILLNPRPARRATEELSVGPPV